MAGIYGEPIEEPVQHTDCILLETRSQSRLHYNLEKMVLKIITTPVSYGGNGVIESEGSPGGAAQAAQEQDAHSGW